MVRMVYERGLRWVSRALTGGEGYGRLSNLAAIVSIITLLSLLSFGQLGQLYIHNALDLGYSYSSAI
jgi:hypothetical protein